MLENKFRVCVMNYKTNKIVSIKDAAVISVHPKFVMLSIVNAETGELYTESFDTSKFYLTTL